MLCPECHNIAKQTEMYKDIPIWTCERGHRSGWEGMTEATMLKNINGQTENDRKKRDLFHIGLF